MATGCYEYACSKFQAILELMMGLFNCYVHCGTIRLMLSNYDVIIWQTAIHNVFCGNGGEKLAMLAEGLLKKHVASHSLHEPEGGLLARSGDYATSATIYQKILELWMAAAGAREPTMIQLIPQTEDCKVSQLADEVFHSRISTSLAFVKKLQADTSNDFIRCPYLATLEIERRKRLHGKGNDDDIVEALMLYFLKFGHLASFSSDVEAFLQVLTPDKKTEFLAKLIKTLDSSATAPTKVLGQSITIFKIQELAGNMYKLPVLELEGCAVQMVEMYCKSLPLSKDLDPQESMHGEELLSMVCNVLVQLFLAYKTSWLLHRGNYGFGVWPDYSKVRYFFTADIVLYIWQYKILLLHLYSHLGAISLAYECHLVILPPFYTHQITLVFLRSKSSSLNLCGICRSDILAYRHRNYSKVIEFVQFKERLQRSNQYLVARVETPILQLKQKADNMKKKKRYVVLENLNGGVHFVELSNEIGSKTLTFNEDFQSRPWWTPTTEKNYLLG
ncbi:hypothetical protein NC651_030992 [Populus alba x Populus x berolinensis]|nr:hypothetical protein NC651_030992 [Populus alba x Populus x berolinensis]